MAAVFLSIKDTVASKFPPDCLKAKTDELKDLAKEKLGETKLDPNNPAHKDKITEWEAGWNVTNAIQVKLNDKSFFRQDIKTCGIELINFGKNHTNLFRVCSSFRCHLVFSMEVIGALLQWLDLPIFAVIPEKS